MSKVEMEFSQNIYFLSNDAILLRIADFIEVKNGGGFTLILTSMLTQPSGDIPCCCSTSIKVVAWH